MHRQPWLPQIHPVLAFRMQYPLDFLAWWSTEKQLKQERVGWHKNEINKPRLVTVLGTNMTNHADPLISRVASNTPLPLA
jgi:hypothetical protein